MDADLITIDVRRVSAKIARLTDMADKHDADAHTHQDLAHECRLGIIELRQFITFARELAEDDLLDETPAATPGRDDDASDAVSSFEGGEPAQSSPPSPEPERAAMIPADPPRSGAAEGNEADLPAPAHIPEPVPAGASADAVDGGSRSSSPAPAVASPTKRDLVLKAHAEHPEWTVREAAEHLGLTGNVVGGYASSLGIKFAPARPASAPPPEPVPAPQPEPDHPEPLPGFGGEFVSLPAIQLRKPKPAKTEFYLRADGGKYLHQSCQGLVPGKSYAWRGTEQQLLRVRERFPETRDMAEEAVR